LAVAPRPDPGAASAGPADEVATPEELELPGASETLTPGRSNVPYVEFLAAEVDEESAREALARLQGEFAESVDPSIANPVFQEKAFGDVTGQVLQRSPEQVLAYAVHEGTLAIADDTAPLERLDSHADDGLARSEAYQAATETLSESPSFLAYLDLAGLVATAERLGAGAEGPFATFAEDLRRLQTFAITVGTEGDLLSSDSLLRISSP
jgi:hypothetical protein